MAGQLTGLLLALTRCSRALKGYQHRCRSAAKPVQISDLGTGDCEIARMTDYKPPFHMTDKNTYLTAEISEQIGRTGDGRNKAPIALDEMSEDSFNHMMKTGYKQAQEDDSFSLDEVFDQIEASISADEK